jgi:pimeloyl-ACP methyl ester carboxylesterase
MTRRSIVLASAAALVLIGVGVYVARNPERKTLDAAARATTQSKFIRLTDGITEYDLTGPATSHTVVLCSGATVPFYLWDSTRVALVANGFRVLRYNYYGRGFSDRPKLPYDLATYDRQLTELLDSLHISEPVDVAGISMGGVIAARFADRHPSRVRSVTLMDPAFSRTSTMPLPMRIPGVGDYIMHTVAAPGMAKGQLSDFLHPERHPEWVSRYEVQMQYKGFLHAILQTMRGDVLSSSAKSFSTLARGQTPILIVWGKSDQTVPFVNSDTVRAAFPRAEFYAIDSAGHLPQIEQAKVVDSVLVNFLRRVSPDGTIVEIRRPTLIAFYPTLAQGVIDTSDDLATVLDDFSFHLGSAMDSLQALGFTVLMRPVDSIVVRNQGIEYRFRPAAESADVGYHLVAPRGTPLTLYGVQTSTDLVAQARQFLQRKASR